MPCRMVGSGAGATRAGARRCQQRCVERCCPTTRHANRLLIPIAVEVDEELRGKYLTVSSPVKFSDFTPHITGAPLLGEHSSQVLTELGYTATQITDMAAAHTIRTQ